MIIPGTQPRSPIGLDVGPRTIAAAQLSRAGGGWQLQAGALLDRPPGAGPLLESREALRIAQVLGRQGFLGRSIVAAVPDQRLVTSMLELPPRSSGAPLEQLARTELARAHRMDAASFEMACWEVPGPNRAAEGAHMMAVACRHSDADELIDGVEAAGLTMAALDARSWAIARACRPALASDERVAAVLDLADSAALLTIVSSGSPAYERPLSDGALEHLRKSIRTRLGIEAELADHIFAGLSLESPAIEDGPAAADAAAILAEHLDNLAGELRTALGYAEHRFDAEIPRLRLQGAGAGIPGIADRLTELLGKPSVVLRPGDVLSVPPRAPDTAQSPALMVAVGLALHEGGAM